METNYNKEPEQPKKPAVKNKGKISRWIYRILMIVCACIFAFSGWKLFTIWSGSHQIDEETSELRTFLQNGKNEQTSDESQTDPSEMEDFNVDWAGLKAANPNVAAWLIVPGTGISYPVVQASDNSYYLSHTFNGADNYIGAIFLDAAADPNFSADNSIIYGHSVDIGGMFTSLKDFANKEFFDTHPNFWLLTPQQNYRATVTAFYQGADQAAVYTTDFGDYREEVLEQIDSEALYTRKFDTANRKFITLSTCNLAYGFSSDQRYVLMGVLEEWNSPVSASEES